MCLPCTPQVTPDRETANPSHPRILQLPSVVRLFGAFPMPGKSSQPGNEWSSKGLMTCGDCLRAPVGLAFSWIAGCGRSRYEALAIPESAPSHRAHGHRRHGCSMVTRWTRSEVDAKVGSTAPGAIPTLAVDRDGRSVVTRLMRRLGRPLPVAIFDRGYRRPFDKTHGGAWANRLFLAPGQGMARQGSGGWRGFPPAFRGTRAHEGGRATGLGLPP